MKSCPKCNNLAPDDAASCGQCGMVLDQSLIARAAGPGRRIPTISESVTGTNATPPPKIEYRPSPPPPISGTVAMGAPPPAAAPASSGRRGQTIFVPSGGHAATGVQLAPVTPARRVIAVLVTYSWKPEGQVFPIREGRNLIGRSDECDVKIPEDAMLSTVNSHITFRQSFTMGDMVSMGGTYLNGEVVEEQFRPLKNLSTIRAGSTQLLFVIVDPKLLDVA